MFASDGETFTSLRLLSLSVRQNERPLVLWIGAGASSWLGYPRWTEFASKMHSDFVRQEPSYERAIAQKYLDHNHLPALFETMRVANEVRYRRTLVDTFQTRGLTPVYERLLKSLEAIAPLNIITTNVDETLERNLTAPQLVQRSDLERLPSLLLDRKPFICKLHGTISAIDSLVFSTRDYSAFQSDAKAMSVLAQVLADSQVVFLGYGVRDDHIVAALANANCERALFGSGPHFLITSDDTQTLPSTVRRVRYLPDEKSDHRAALTAIEEIVAARKSDAVSSNISLPSGDAPTVRPSICHIATLYPTGTFETSQTLEFGSAIDGATVGQAVLGDGYTNAEIPHIAYSPFQDLAVALACFDVLSLTLGHLSRLHDLLGGDVFWQLALEGSIRLVHCQHVPVVIFANPQALSGGCLATIQAMGEGGLGDKPREPQTVEAIIRNHLQPLPGKEAEAETLFKDLTSKVLVLTEEDSSKGVLDRARSALVRPSVQNLLGMSCGTPLTSIPRWMVFPVLRLANVMTAATVCERIGASATRMVFGAERIASAAFASQDGPAWADDAGNYVLTGRFSSSAGEMLATNRGLFRHLIEFRQSSAGESFRKEIRDRLSVNEGGDVAAAINAGLTQALPISALESARAGFSTLFTPITPTQTTTRAVWGDSRIGDNAIRQWRVRSKSILEQVCETANIRPYDTCPCGSGEKLRFCCADALRAK